MSSNDSPRSHDDLATAFAAHRAQLRSIAYRMLGSHWDADDAVQGAWLRLRRAKNDDIENLGAWLTTAISRACIDQMRNRSARHEDLAADLPEDDSAPAPAGPEATALRADEVSAAMHVVLDALGPLERLAFVLHDIFGLSFDDIAPIVERTPTNARQLASRARHRIRNVDVATERARRREAVDAFLKASRDGDFGALLQLLDPDVELRADDDAVAVAAPHAAHGAPLLQTHVRGADAVARVFAGRATLTRLALIDGLPAATYAPDGTPQAAYFVRIEAGRITRIDIVGDPHHLDDLTITVD